MRTSCLAIVFSICAAFGTLAEAADGGIVGIWTVTQELRGEENEYTLTITGQGGTWTAERGTFDLSNVNIENDTLSFVRMMRGPNRDTPVTYKATLVDGALVGTMTSPRGDTPFTAARIPESVLRAIEDRENAIASLEKCDILVVFAHPDDETFATGTFAKLSKNGQRIQLIYATSGDAGGDQTGQGRTGDDLAKAREQEMINAANVLNVEAAPLFLRYPDGFVRENWNDILANVEAVFEKTQPKIVITFGPDGYYGHADHLAIGQIAERAFDKLGIASHLLHAAIPKSINDMIISAGGGDRYKAVDDKYITYTVNVKKQIQQRVASMEAHESQFDQQTVTQFRLLGSMTGTEGFVEVRNLGQSGTLADLFKKGDTQRKRVGE